MNLMLSLIVTLFAFLNVSSLEASVKDLSWMEGEWLSIDPKMPMKSQYTYDSTTNVIKGLTRVVQNGQTVFAETETIKEERGTFVLTVGQAGSEAVSFYLTAQARNVVKFTNMRNSFPQVIEYFLDTQGRLVGRIKGNQQGNQVSQKFVLQKVH